jgi:hypothetical protein
MKYNIYIFIPKTTKNHVFQNFSGKVKNGHKKACPKSQSSKKFAEK